MKTRTNDQTIVTSDPHCDVSFSVHRASPSLCFSDAPSIFQNIHLFIISFESNFVDCLWLRLTNTLSLYCNL
jgi:hypothetical protein